MGGIGWEKRGRKKEPVVGVVVVVGLSQEHVRRLLLLSDMHSVLCYRRQLWVHTKGWGGDCVNIVTYCVVLFVGLLSAGGANPSVEMHFKVLHCTEQENILYLY